MFATLFAALALTPAPPLRLGDLLKEAHERNPELHASNLRADAASRALPAAGALDDPMLMVQLWNAPADFSTVPVMAQLTQPIPLGGKRALRADAAAADAELSKADAVKQRREVDLAVERSFFELYLATRTDAVDAELQGTLRALEQSALARVRVGLGAHAEVLRVQAAEVELEAQREVAEQQARSARVKLASLLDRPTDPPAGDPADPGTLASLPDESALRERALRERPELAGAAAQVAAADAEARLAGAERIPDVAPTLGAMHTFRGTGEQNFVFIGAQVNLPVWSTGRSCAELAGAQARADAARAEALALRDRIESEVADVRAQVESERRLIDLHHRLIPLTREALESALNAYAAGKGDFLTVIDTVRELQMHEIELAMHLAAYEQHLAELERAVGADLGLVAASESGGADAHH